jgi:LmbE family N-acetylglucosaminyl deacetylase
MSKRVLVIAPHPDDETLGLGGTITKFVEQGHEVNLLVVSGHLPPVYNREDYELTLSEAKNALKILGIENSTFLEIPATKIGDLPINELNKKFADAVDTFKPQIVFCPYPDRHIDHRLVFESTMVATRPVGSGKYIEILGAYETLSETHWNAPHIEPNFTPNWIINISDQIENKVKALECYKSQISESPGPRSIEAAKALAHFRGTQAGFAFGEGVHIIRKIS